MFFTIVEALDESHSVLGQSKIISHKQEEGEDLLKEKIKGKKEEEKEEKVHKTCLFEARELQHAWRDLWLAGTFAFLHLYVT